MLQSWSRGKELQTLSKVMQVAVAAFFLAIFQPAAAQTPPSPVEAASYTGLHAAAYTGDVGEIRRLVSSGANFEKRDHKGRTPVHVAAFQSHDDAVKALAEAGADLNVLENDKYDIITIAAVAGDAALVKTAIVLGGNPANVTSIYDGTALIAAAHLGHDAVVRALIDGGAPLDHINNLGWTALIEAVILGDGGPRHVRTVEALVGAGADVTIADRQGATPLSHARSRGYAEITALIEAAVK